MTGRVHIAVSTGLYNAGEATRAIELAKALREQCPHGRALTVTFLSHGSPFEAQVVQAGFAVARCAPHGELANAFPELAASAEQAQEFIAGQAKVLAQLAPTLVLHGFWQVGHLAARLVGLPTVAYLAVPPPLLKAGLVGLGIGIPPQRNLAAAAVQCGWPGEPPQTMFDMLAADRIVVNDLPEFYAGQELPVHIEVTGPIFAPSAEDAALDPVVTRLLSPGDPKPKILCTMGSSGSKAEFLEAVHALRGGQWNAVILASPAVCPLEEAKQAAGGDDRLFVTDQFLPAPTLSAMVDVVLSHGGQGTVQTAMACGTPVVGVGLQMEQMINLDHVASAGAGVSIPRPQWRAEQIRQSLQTVLHDKRFRHGAEQVATLIAAADGRLRAAQSIWAYAATL